jgi:hypothetical protein
MERAEKGEATERRAAVEALGRWKVREASPLLIRLVDDPDARVRRAAVTALREIGGEEAHAVIARLIGSADKKVRKMAGEVLQGEPSTPRWASSETTGKRLLKIRPEVRMDAYISTDAAMRFGLPEIRPYGETEFTSCIASVCCDYSATRRRFIELGLFTRTYRPGKGCIYEFTELGEAVWRAERFIVDRYLKRMV